MPSYVLVCVPRLMIIEDSLLHSFFSVRREIIGFAGSRGEMGNTDPSRLVVAAQCPVCWHGETSTLGIGWEFAVVHTMANYRC